MVSDFVTAAEKDKKRSVKKLFVRIKGMNKMLAVRTTAV